MIGIEGKRSGIDDLFGFRHCNDPFCSFPTYNIILSQVI
jgi:hypothetical protein